MDFLNRLFISCVVWLIGIIIYILLFSRFSSYQPAYEIIFNAYCFIFIGISWWFSGNITQHEYYDHFVDEILATPNNSQLKFIMVPTISILVFSYAFGTNGSISGFFTGSFIYGILVVNAWFWGALFGLNSSDYDNTFKLRLSAFWAVLAPVSIHFAIDYQYFLLISCQTMAMFFSRVLFCLKAISERQS